MLLNELKQIFETDREALGGALAAADLNFNPNVSSGAGKKSGGDVDPSLKDVVERCIVTADFAAASKDEIEALTGQPEAQKKTVQSLNNLTGTLYVLESNFTSALLSIAPKIEQVAGDEKFNVFLQTTLRNLRQEDSDVYRDTYNNTLTVLQRERVNLVRTLMKFANTTAYGQHTIREIKNISTSAEWFEADGKTVKRDAATKLRKQIENFYAVIVKLQQNTEKLTTQFTNVAKAAPTPKV